MDIETPAKLAIKQARFIAAMRECMEAIKDREFALSEAATLFCHFAEASDALIIDFSKDCLNLYRSSNGDEQSQQSTVVMEESLVPLLELVLDRCLDSTGLRIHNQKIIDPPEDVPADVLQASFEELGLSSGFVFPLAVTRNYGTDKIQGLVVIRDAKPARFADPLVFALLRMSVDLLSLCADNCDLGDALSRLRANDPVTGLSTPHQLATSLDRELERSAFFGRNLALVMADLDRLANFNYEHGHMLGDYAIKAAADQLAVRARSIDVVCRYRGEKFMVLLPEAGAEQAVEFAESCRRAIAEQMIKTGELDTDAFITASFGVVVSPEHGNRAASLLNKVELAVLKSKLNGRNTVSIWSDDIDSV